MNAITLSGLLKKGDRVAVSNITGREAEKVSIISQLFCNNIVGGWALAKGGEVISVAGGRDIRVFNDFESIMKTLPEKERPNKIIVYSPPDAVYGDVKEVIQHGQGTVETVYVITEHVSIEVTAKLKHLCNRANIDVIGCNTLGIINARDKVRVGAVGGDAPAESFIPGSATIISNSGNMVNTVASYMQSAGLGISYGIATGKDSLILTPLKELLAMANKDRNSKIIILYVEPGGTYERDAIEYMKTHKFSKPLLVYVAGAFAEGKNISLGHAGAVVEGACTSSTDKMKLFDDYFGVPPFDPIDEKTARRNIARTKRGIRVTTLHGLVPAAAVMMDALGIAQDFKPVRPLVLNPWLVDLGQFARRLPKELVLKPGTIPSPYKELMVNQLREDLGRTVNRQSMRNASHASSNDGVTPRIYGYSLPKLMEGCSFSRAVLLAWLGVPPAHDFEVDLFEMCLTASITNGPGTISAQAAKLSASAGNEPNTAIMATLGAIGLVHGGNGKEAARFVIKLFRDTGLTDPYDKKKAPDLDKLVRGYVYDYKKRKKASREEGSDVEKIPCLGHPVFNRDAVNYDPRERVVSKYLEENRIYNVFLDFYHRLTRELTAQGVTGKSHAVNVDAALTCVCMGIAWPMLVNRQITLERVYDLPFLTFALGRVAGGAAEYLDHREYGTDMDMRIPNSECRFLTRPKD
jgi:succinyl-CoA synthetase alpha subunit